MHVMITNTAWNRGFRATLFMLAKCTRKQTTLLWEGLHGNVVGFQDPWLSGGDFNNITQPDEYIGQGSFDTRASADFNSCIQGCPVLDFPFSSNSHTWTSTEAWGSSHLDKISINEEWLGLFSTASVQYLNRTLSDRPPLLLKWNLNSVSQGPSYFKF
ncbi:hypothetical protein ACH5RR_033712 [Cinchona calisaya]|uniref:Endonuclease/exonuclease/phosphatase n=1 Tax=Cinchona calisaya TaxID=153742 RepID=A0ABD2Y8S5_9GENT